MKTINDLLALFEPEKTQINISDSIIATRDGEGDIDFKIKEKDTMFAWIGSDYLTNDENGDNPISDHVSITTPTMFANVALFMEFAEWMGCDMPAVDPVEIEKPVEVVKEVDSPEQKKLEGKVEAYENILLGREITAGR